MENKMWKSIAVPIALLVGLSGCSPSGPDCAGQAETALAIKIAKEHFADTLTASIFMSSRKNEELRAKLAETCRDLEKYEGPSLNGCGACALPSDEGAWKPVFDALPKDGRIAAFKSKAVCAGFEADQSDAKSKADWNLSLIRMIARDSETKRVTCAAKLTVDAHEFGSQEWDVKYIVDTLSAGGIYVTVEVQ
jgi:hypothetical protein